jgi:hypothetical protein
MTDAENKKRFITYELGLLSLKAALSTRDSEYPIYAKGVKLHQRKSAKHAFRAVLEDIESVYADGDISEDDHVKYIEKTANNLSTKLGCELHNGRFRIGVAQKLINLHLKYLWASGHIQEPPHCPIDGIIRDKANIKYDWTTSDCIDEYRKAVKELKKVSGKKSLSAWELEIFRRRDDA